MDGTLFSCPLWVFQFRCANCKKTQIWWAKKQKQEHQHTKGNHKKDVLLFFWLVVLWTHHIWYGVDFFFKGMGEFFWCRLWLLRGFWVRLSKVAYINLDNIPWTWTTRVNGISFWALFKAMRTVACPGFATFFFSNHRFMHFRRPNDVQHSSWWESQFALCSNQWWQLSWSFHYWAATDHQWRNNALQGAGWENKQMLRARTPEGSFKIWPFFVAMLDFWGVFGETIKRGIWVVVSNIFSFWTLPEEVIQFDEYFSNRLKPPTRSGSGVYWDQHFFLIIRII